ncbi:MAG: UrcA family protein [Gammaproteobacteria bacterium]
MRGHPLARRAPLPLAVLLGIAAVSLYASGSTERAQPEGVTIPYGDLDLSTVSGAMELERRLVEAADAVCAELDSSAVPREALERCRMDAVAGAILVLRRPAAAAVVSS